MESLTFHLILFLSFKMSYGGGDDLIFATDPCEPGDTDLYAHPECQMFYNCSLKYFKPWLGDHVVECNYPDLYSISLQSCQPHKTVECGNRKELKNGCEYRNNQCNGPHCRGCSYDYADCTVKNGVIPMDSMPNSPFFGVCDDWRFTKMTCPAGMIFDKTSNDCVNSKF